MATLLSTLSKARTGILLSRWSKPDRQVVPCMEWQRCYPLCPRQGPVSYCPVGPSQTGKLSHAWNGNAAIHFVQARWTSCGILLSRWSKPDRQVVPCMEWQRCYPLCPSQVDQLSKARTGILLSRWSRPERQARTPQCMDQERCRSARSTGQMDRFFSAWDDRAAVLLVHVRFASSPINGSVP